MNKRLGDFTLRNLMIVYVIVYTIMPIVQRLTSRFLTAYFYMAVVVALVVLTLVLDRPENLSLYGTFLLPFIIYELLSAFNMSEDFLMWSYQVLLFLLPVILGYYFTQDKTRLIGSYSKIVFFALAITTDTASSAIPALSSPPNTVVPSLLTILPSTTGFTSTLSNVGAMKNRGWEISVNVDILKKDDWDLSVGANWSTIDNEILSLSEEGETQTSRPYIWKAGYAFYQYYSRHYLGYAKEDYDDGYGHVIKAGMPLYAEGSFYEKGETVDMDVLDAACEFLNCNNGLYATKLSHEDVELDMLPPVMKDSTTTIRTEGNMYRVPFYIKDKKVDLIVCIESKWSLD